MPYSLVPYNFFKNMYHNNINLHFYSFKSNLNILCIVNSLNYYIIQSINLKFVERLSPSMFSHVN